MDPRQEDALMDAQALMSEFRDHDYWTECPLNGAGCDDPNCPECGGEGWIEI
jgi:hypothetical protein